MNNDTRKQHTRRLLVLHGEKDPENFHLRIENETRRAAGMKFD